MATSLPEDMLAAFLRGEHVCRHHSGVWNSVFLDQFGEQTYIRYGKSKGGLVGKTLSSEQTAVWVLSHHICNTLSLAVDSLFDENTDEDYDEIVNVKIHKEEGDNRRNLDSADRQKITEELKKHTNPLPTQPEDPLANIINGRLAPAEVNVDKSIDIGDKMAGQFLSHLPDNFYQPLKQEVVTMEAMKKCVKVGCGKVYDMEKLYARLLIVAEQTYRFV